jgi:hypothetical protein
MGIENHFMRKGLEEVNSFLEKYGKRVSQVYELIHAEHSKNNKS